MFPFDWCILLCLIQKNLFPKSPIKNSTFVTLSTVATKTAFALLLSEDANTSVLSLASTKFVALVQLIAKYPGLVVEILKFVGEPGGLSITSTPVSSLNIFLFR